MKPTRFISSSQPSNQQLQELMLLRQHVTDAFKNGSDDILSLCLNYKVRSEELKVRQHIVFAFYMLGEFNKRLENYSQAINYYQGSLKRTAASDPELRYQTTIALASCYQRSKKYQTAIKFYQSALEQNSSTMDWQLFQNIAICYVLLKKIDEANASLNICFDKLGMPEKNNSNHSEHIETLFRISTILMVQKKYGATERILARAIDIIQTIGSNAHSVIVKYHLALLHYKKNEIELSFAFVMEAYLQKDILEDKALIFKIVLLLAEVSGQTQQKAQASQYFEQALLLANESDLKDIVQYLDKYYLFLEAQEHYEQAYIVLKDLQEKSEELDLREKEAELYKARIIYENREQEIRLENLTAVNELNKELLYRTDELEEKNVKLEKVKRELMEGQLLRSQMNPHFIYNSLNSISSLIKTEENEKADKYLLKFSRLTRDIFSNSTKEKVTLASEIRIVRDYLEMEMLRFKDRFSYQLEVSEDMVVEEIDIPPMILQPIVENAIKHGIFHLGENILGKVKIKISPSVHPANHKKAIQIEVTDNGVGLKVKNNFLKSQHKKSALFITIKRLHHFNKTESQLDNMFYEVREPHGTKFTIYIIT